MVSVLLILVAITWLVTDIDPTLGQRRSCIKLACILFSEARSFVKGEKFASVVTAPHVDLEST